MKTENSIEFSERAKAFSTEGVRRNKFRVDLDDGTVRVWDCIAGHYTTVHGMSKAAESRIRKMAHSKQMARPGKPTQNDTQVSPPSDTFRHPKRHKMKLTITHDGFHGETSCTILVCGQPGETVVLSAGQIKKLSRAACGMSDCRCGETMLKALSDYGVSQEPCLFVIPEDGNEIQLRGSYPQQ